MRRFLRNSRATLSALMLLGASALPLTTQKRSAELFHLSELRRSALEGAARAFEAEGDLELALHASIEAHAVDDARRLLPAVSGNVVPRLDLHQAPRLTDAGPL